MRNMALWGMEESRERLRAETLALVQLLAGERDPCAVLAGDARAAALLGRARAVYAALYDAEGIRISEAPFLPEASLSPARLATDSRPRAGSPALREGSAPAPLPPLTPPSPHAPPPSP